MIEIAYDQDDDFLFIRIVGWVAWEEVYRAVSEKKQADGIPPAVDYLLDLRDMDFPSVTYENLQPIASKRREWNDTRANSNSAYVVRSEIEEKIITLLKALSTGAIRGTEKTFLSVEKAKTWLRDLKTPSA